MKKNVVRILTAVLMLSVVFSSSVFAAEKEQSAWDSFVGLFTGNAVTVADTQVDGVTYRTHIQNDGWAQGWVSDGDMSGSEGRGLRLEGIEIKIDGDTLPDGLGITYRTHIENDGWAQGWVEDGEMSGSYGRGLRLEAIEIKLTGDNADDYTVLYRTHIQNDGWAQGWVADGELSGSEGRGLRLEGIEIKIEQKTADLTEYEAALADVTQADYTAASWTAYQAVVNANVVDEDNLQSEVDEATAAITAAQANLVLVPKVTSVTAINAKQIQIAFNKAMDKTTLINDNNTATTDDDLLLATAVNIAGLDSQGAPNVITVASANATLSADGKTLTVTPQTTEWFKDRYAITVFTTVKDTTKLALTAKFTGNITVNETARPTLTGVTYINFETVKAAFSEPLGTLGTISYKLADGTAVTGATDGIVNGNIQISLNGIATANNNKEITVTIVAAKDYAGNLISPNPITFTVKKDTTATTKPVVSSIAVTGNATYDITFSSALMTAPTVTTGGTATVLVKDINNSALYHATVGTLVTPVPKTGLQTIAYSTFTGITGVAGDAASTTANFTAESNAPVISSSKVEKINGIEYLVLTYNENVTPIAAKDVTGSYLDNYVTTPMPTLTTGAVNTAFSLYNAVDNKSVSVKLELTTLTKATEYTVKLPESLVTDLFGNKSAEVSNFKFTRTSNSSTNAPKVTAVGQGSDNNKVDVTFDKTVDGPSALTASNYTVEGATIESVELTANTTVGIVQLNLVKDSNTFTGSHAVTVQGVKSQSGDVMDTVTLASTNLNENVRPTITKAQLTAVNVITLTFSEVVNNPAGVDFDVYIGGVQYAGVITEALVAPDNKTITLTLADNITAAQLASGVVVKKAATNAVTDTLLNPLNFTNISVTQ